MDSSALSRVAARYVGRVQGVGFRATTVALIGGVPIVGWVRNESDGTVLLEAEGSREDLKDFLRRIDEAMGVKITRKNIDWIEPKQTENRFSIRYS